MIPRSPWEERAEHLERVPSSCTVPFLDTTLGAGKGKQSCISDSDMVGAFTCRPGVIASPSVTEVLFKDIDAPIGRVCISGVSVFPYTSPSHLVNPGNVKTGHFKGQLVTISSAPRALTKYQLRISGCLAAFSTGLGKGCCTPFARNPYKK